MLYNIYEQNVLSYTIILNQRYIFLCRVRPVSRCTSSMPGHSQPVIVASFSPTGRFLVSCVNVFIKVTGFQFKMRSVIGRGLHVNVLNGNKIMNPNSSFLIVPVTHKNFCNFILGFWFRRYNGPVLGSDH